MARVFLTNMRHRDISIRGIEAGYFCSVLVITEKPYVAIALKMMVKRMRYW
jgi:hypothetical protein